MTATLCTFAGSAGFAADGVIQEQVAIIVPSGETFCLDAAVRRQLDAAAARVSKLDGRRVVKIEGFSRRGVNSEERVRNSLLLAMMAEKYFRGSRSLHREVYLAAATELPAGAREFIRIVTFPDDFATYHASQFVPQTPRQ